MNIGYLLFMGLLCTTLTLWAIVAIRDDGYISTKHFCIEFTPQGAVALTDLVSRHGTAVNGQPLQPNQPMALRGSERIRAGESDLSVRVEVVWGLG